LVRLEIKDGFLVMLNKTFSTVEASNYLGIRVSTLYDWLGQSDAGTFTIRGQNVTIEYFQGGARGQGRIRIKQIELDRLIELMKVRPMQRHTRQAPRPKTATRHITAKLGRPGD
jgi:hypothetical protein